MKNAIKNIIKVMRIRQWYKNLIIFLPIVFAKQIFNLNSVAFTIIGFVALSLMCSTNYIINDIIDREKDRMHPEKKSRPIASGKIKVSEGILLAVILFIISGLLSFKLSLLFFGLNILLFASTLFYSLYFKNEPFLDIIVLSSNFVIRAVSGAFVITKGFLPYISVSPWLILCPFFLALFLSSSKREGDIRFLGEKAGMHRSVLTIYNKELTRALMIISTTLLIITYSLYTFYSEFKGLLISLPVVLYIIFRYFYLTETGSEISRQTEKIYKDKKIMLAVLLMMIIIFLSIYL
jgi:4-hydroxybenzoate polyprenyltransferase